MYPLFSFKLLMRWMRKVEVQYSTAEPLKLKNVLLLHKLSRLELEKISLPHLNESDLKKNILKRGLEYDVLLEYHKRNIEFREKVQSSFKQFGIELRNVNRFNCSASDIEWCDAVFPIGGDGTFLHTARYIMDANKPVIGFNSDPSTSEGFLCLPKKYSSDPAAAIKKLLQGKFKWMFRTRIRVNFEGEQSNQPPTELHDMKPYKCKPINTYKKEKTDLGSKKFQQTLPILGLNEIFMSELFAAKVSFFEMRLNNSHQSVKVKSSGLCVSTGTGSTSWNLSINRISEQDIREVVKIYLNKTNGTANENFDDLVTYISKCFNEKLRFGPEERILGYTIRDLISVRVWPHPKGLIEHRGFAETIEVKSRCLDAGLIIDGGISFPFNEGAIAVLETRPEDALRTVVILE